MSAYGEETFNIALERAKEAIQYIIEEKRSRGLYLLEATGDYQDAIDFYADEDPNTANYLIGLREAILKPVR